jgi:hypothetical protein
VSGPVVAQDPEGLMPWSLPALGTTGCAAYDFKVAAASCARRPAFARPPVDDHRAGLPGVPEAALLREARKRRVACLRHVPYSNIRSTRLKDVMTPRLVASIAHATGHAHLASGMLLGIEVNGGLPP